MRLTLFVLISLAVVSFGAQNKAKVASLMTA